MEFQEMMMRLQQLIAVGGIGWFAAYAGPDIYLLIKSCIKKHKQLNDPINWGKIGVVKNEETPILVNDQGGSYIYALPEGMCIGDIQKKQAVIEQIFKTPVEIKLTDNYMIQIKLLNSKYQDKYYLDFAGKLLKGMNFHVGRTLQNQEVKFDLKTAPHMLLAGTTGSGKSVCLNSIMLQLILKKQLLQERLQINVIDFKGGLEFVNYEDYIETLAGDTKEADTLVMDIARTMERRYKLLKELKVKDIDEYNTKTNKKLDRIFLIIDEFAELSLVNKKSKKENKIENVAYTQINRLLFKGRAAGIHVIIATQYPSTDVIDAELRRNLNNHIIFGNSPDSVLDIMKGDKAVGKPAGVGFLNANGKTTEFKGYFVNSEVIKAVLAKLPANTSNDKPINKPINKANPKADKPKRRKPPIQPIPNIVIPTAPSTKVLENPTEDIWD